MLIVYLIGNICYNVFNNDDFQVQKKEVPEVEKIKIKRFTVCAHQPRTFHVLPIAKYNC